MQHEDLPDSLIDAAIAHDESRGPFQLSPPPVACQQLKDACVELRRRRGSVPCPLPPADDPVEIKRRADIVKAAVDAGLGDAWANALIAAGVTIEEARREAIGCLVRR